MSHLIHPISAGLCVPLFAFFSAGVDFRSIGLVDSLSTPVAIGIMVGLVVGKPIGVLGGAWLTARFTRASLSEDLEWADVFAVASLAGIGFTVPGPDELDDRHDDALLAADLGCEIAEQLRIAPADQRPAIKARQ